MPVYPQIKTYRGGFYNNKVVDGTNDRTYSAKDIRKPYELGCEMQKKRTECAIMIQAALNED